jgi:hypothetical protein
MLKNLAFGYAKSLESSGCTDITVEASFVDEKQDTINIEVIATPPPSPYVEITLYVKDNDKLA